MDPQEMSQWFFAQNGIKQEFEQTLPARAERYLKVKPHGVVPFTHVKMGDILYFSIFLFPFTLLPCRRQPSSPSPRTRSPYEALRVGS